MSTVAEADEREEYPPAKHLIRDLRLDVTHHGGDASTLRIPVVDEILTDQGTIRLGVIATVVDVIGGGLAALAAAPDWIATSDLSAHLACAARADELVAQARVLRKGRSTVVIEVDLGDAAGRPLGFGMLTFALLPFDRVRPRIDVSGVQRRRMPSASAGFEHPLLDEVGIEVVDAEAGTVTMPLTPYVQNSFRALQGGMIGLVADVAAEHALRAATNAPVVVTDLVLSYLELGRVGPFTTQTDVRATASEHGAANVTVVDTGQDDGLRMSVARVRAAVAR